MAEVLVQQLVKRYGRGVTAVDECSLSVTDGRCAVIVGPSGCGKSTLLRLIAGLESPDSGTVCLNGNDVTAKSPAKRDIAMVFQDFALYPHMSVRKNMAFPLRTRKVAVGMINRRVEEAATLLGIIHLLDQKPGELSGGERQRAAVGRVMVQQPACALFDEPLSNLDASLRAQLRGELRALHSKFNTTSIYVTHDQEEALGLADMLVVMAQGKFQQIGPPMEVFRRPANRFVAGFIGSSKMNFIQGRVNVTGKAVTLCCGDGLRLPLDAAAIKFNNAEVVLGIRPELFSQAADDDAAIMMRVDSVQTLGFHCDLLGTIAERVQIRVRWREPVPVGESIALQYDPAQTVLFEPGEFGTALA